MSTPKQCYFPNGSPEQTLIPCNPSDSNSPCCVIGDSCMGNGICQMTNGLLYRGGCTDNLWNADECPKVCSSKQQNGRDSGAPAGISFIKSCFNRAIPEQTRNPPWVCGAATNCTDPFVLAIGSVQIANLSQTSPSPSSTPPPSLSPSCDTSSAKTTIGAGVGIPLGLLFLISLAWALWERRKRKSLEKSYKSAGYSNSAAGELHSNQRGYQNQYESYGKPGYNDNESIPLKSYNNNNGRTELGSEMRSELGSPQRSELPSSHG